MTRVFLAAAFAALVQGQGINIKSFSVGPDRALAYPSGPADPQNLKDHPDEHATFMPPACADAPDLIFGQARSRAAVPRIRRS